MAAACAFAQSNASTAVRTLMKARTALRRSIVYAVAAVTAGLLLSGCATPGPDAANGCVGPPGFCQMYFGS
jgi:hypothetical protein